VKAGLAEHGDRCGNHNRQQTTAQKGGVIDSLQPRWTFKGDQSERVTELKQLGPEGLKGRWNPKQIGRLAIISKGGWGEKKAFLWTIIRRENSLMTASERSNSPPELEPGTIMGSGMLTF
jgi:hypothetical protein